MKNKFFLLVLFQVSVIFGQQRNVTGQVTSAEDGMTLPGVNVIVKGTNQGTVTDIDGNYSISVPEDATLVYSFLGFEGREMQVEERSVIDINLEEDL